LTEKQTSAAMTAKPHNTAGACSAVPVTMQSVLSAGVKRSHRAEAPTRGSVSQANPCSISRERTASVIVM
jgi:hypothetical protein